MEQQFATGTIPPEFDFCNGAIEGLYDFEKRQRDLQWAIRDLLLDDLGLRPIQAKGQNHEEAVESFEDFELNEFCMSWKPSNRLDDLLCQYFVLGRLIDEQRFYTERRKAQH